MVWDWGNFEIVLRTAKRFLSLRILLLLRRRCFKFLWIVEEEEDRWIKFNKEKKF